MAEDKIEKKRAAEKELAEIAYYSLKFQGEDEEGFLLPLTEMLKTGKCPAEG